MLNYQRVTGVYLLEKTLPQLDPAHVKIVSFWIQVPAQIPAGKLGSYSIPQNDALNYTFLKKACLSMGPVQIHLSIYLSLSLYINIYLYIYISVYIYVYMHI